MRRRSFLKTIAAAASSAPLTKIFAQPAAAALPASPAVHVVGSGEDYSGHSHSLGFSSLNFKVPSTATGGSLFLMEHTHLLPGGPPLHLHMYQDEWFYVMEGEVAFQVGSQQVNLHAGESVLAPRGIPHTFSAVGPSPSRLLIAFVPAGRMEQYFRDAETAVEHAGDADFMARYEMKRIGPSPFWKT